MLSEDCICVGPRASCVSAELYGFAVLGCEGRPAAGCRAQSATGVVHDRLGRDLEPCSR